MREVLSERPLSLAEACQLPCLRRPDGSSPSVGTLFRWIHVGCNGRRLEHRRIGRTIVTTAEAIERFVMGEGVQA